MKKKINMDYSKIPKPIIDAINNADIYSKLEGIGKKYSLHVDQLGELNMYLERVLVGLETGAGFIDRINKNIGIDIKTAKDIATDINTEIISTILDQIKEFQNNNEISSSIASISENGHKKTINIIEAIENPSSVKTPINMIDHLLTTPVTTPKETVMASTPVVEAKQTEKPPIVRGYPADPYREPIQ